MNSSKSSKLLADMLAGKNRYQCPCGKLWIECPTHGKELRSKQHAKTTEEKMADIKAKMVFARGLRF